MMKNTLCYTDSPRNGDIARDLWIEQLLAVRANELSSSAKIAGASVAMNIDPNTGRCEHSREALAEFAGMDSRSLRRMIKKLEVAGWLGVERSVGHFPNSFQLTIPDELASARSVIGGRANG